MAATCPFSIHCDIRLANRNSSANLQEVIHGLFEGCYRDTHNSLTAKGNHHQRLPRTNTNARCVGICRSRGFAVAATKGDNCYCSNSLPVPELHPPTDRKAAGNGGPCSTVCPGAFVTSNCRGDECCGGETAYSVYILDSIDILKELVNRIAINFKNSPSRVHDAILTPDERNLLNCQCFSGQVSIYLTAKVLNSKEKKSSIRTVKGSIDIGNYHTVNDNKPIRGLKQIDLVLKNMEELPESDHGKLLQKVPFGKWNLLCDNTNGGAELSCQKDFSESAGFTRTYSTEHGVSAGVRMQLEWTSKALVAESTKQFEISLGYSFNWGYSHSREEVKTEGFQIQMKVQKGTKAEVHFFKGSIPVKIKWRAHFFADGDVLIDYGSVGIKKKVHLSQLLSYEQRKVFAFGTIDYGERPTIIAITKTVDKNGRLISENEVKKA